jgi:DNA-binding TFAR19-related protein (PDSD5 family)
MRSATKMKHKNGHCLSKKKLLRTVTNDDALEKLDKVCSVRPGFQESLYVERTCCDLIVEKLLNHPPT